MRNALPPTRIDYTSSSGKSGIDIGVHHCLPSLKQRYAAALGLSTILFMWPLDVSFGSIGVPIYFITSIYFIHVTKFSLADVIRFMGGIICLSFLLYIQKLQGVMLTTPLRSIISVLFISFIAACTYRWLTITIKGGPFPLFKIFNIWLMFQLVLQIFQLIAWYIGIYEIPTTYYLLNIPRVTGIFAEPSHVAFSLSPFIYLLFCYPKLANKWLGKGGILCLSLILLLCPSTTMIGVIYIALVFKQIQSTKTVWSAVSSAFVFLSVGSILVFAIVNMPEVNIRVADLFNVIVGSSRIWENINLTSLVYIKGAEMALAGLLHYPLGVGLQNIQILNDYSVASSVSELMYRLNSMDASSIAFKLIGEYGYLGVLIVILTFANCIKSVRSFDFKNVLFGFFLFGMIISFLRGGSYFDGVPIIALTILFMKTRSITTQIIHS